MFEIHSLRLGELKIPHGAGFVRDPIHAWYVTDGKTGILVDSGMPDAADLKRRLNVDGEGGGQQSLRDALAAVGATPEDVDHIILTHLHFDHAWNLELFPAACVLVQRDELVHAIDPVATQRIYYFKETMIELLGRRRPGRFRIVDGDCELLKGVTLLKAPSHTPGMQVALVETERGKAALVSDLGEHYRCWHPADPRATHAPMRYLSDTFLPGSIRSESERDYVANMGKVRALADIIVPAHDFRIPVHMPADWYDVPASNDDDLTRMAG